MTELEQRIVRELQEDLPLVPNPFKVIADRLGLTEVELLDKIRELQACGIIRRFGAVLRHREAGIEANAMVVWRVPPERVEEVGVQMAAFSAVSHCYARLTYPDWPYSLFTMIHGRDRQQCQQITEEIARTVGIEDYQLLFSTAELKKTSMRYFVKEG
ncbi:MAG: Lrp/AsnC family transcriptional regulator [Firmicutes bacterium]|nr:Lrp/AsnC family transcriptional regulator [Bacillota bacterium]